MASDLSDARPATCSTGSGSTGPCSTVRPTPSPAARPSAWCWPAPSRTGPEVLLADEPTSALDTAATRRLEHLARSLADDGLPVVWVTHDLDQVRRLADHLVVLRAGRVTWAGPASSDGAADALAATLGRTSA